MRLVSHFRLLALFHKLCRHLLDGLLNSSLWGLLLFQFVSALVASTSPSNNRNRNPMRICEFKTEQWNMCSSFSWIDLIAFYLRPTHTCLTKIARCSETHTNSHTIVHYISVSGHLILIHISVRNSDCRDWITVLPMIFPSWNTYNYSKWLSLSMIASSSSVHLGTVMSWFWGPATIKEI